ncbi:hypothetical protein FACS189440_01080 [Bacteroidia bacterium]|nr:hypothetical protein FACS189423_09340 [Bacteroidia bacterium]GHT45316.1 hypothetical protein FACS189440_01080 [Bacteroidia bacterium]
MENLVNKRIRQLIKSENITLKKFCEIIDISNNTINTIFQRDSNPGSDILIKIAEKFPNYSMTWLLVGRGNIEIPETTIEINLDYKEMYDKIMEDLNKSLLKNNELYEENRNLRIQLEEIKNKMVN